MAQSTSAVLPSKAHLEYCEKYPMAQQLSYIAVMEDIARGERILGYRLSGFSDGKWLTIGEGSCIGHKRIETVKSGEYTKVRLEITKSNGEPVIRDFACYTMQ